MATIEFRTYHAKRSDSGFLQVIFNLDGTPAPFPPRVVECKNTLAALEAFRTYKMDAAATGLPMVATLDVKAGRAPNGFKKATANPHYHPVNI